MCMPLLMHIQHRQRVAQCVRLPSLCLLLLLFLYVLSGTTFYVFSRLVDPIRSLSSSSFLSSESRSNAVTELVEVPSIDYAESQKKY